MLVGYDGSRYTAQDVLARIESQKTNVQLVESVLFCAAYKKTGGGEMYIQRNKDRRGFGGKTSFPLKTKEGGLVEEDRRSIPDRRLGNIHLEFVDAVDHGFSGRFADTLFSLPGKDDY